MIGFAWLMPLTVYENARRRNPGALMAALAALTARKPTRPDSRTARDLPIFAGVSGVRRLMSLAEVALLGCSVVGIALAWDAADWDPLGLWVLLLVVALVSDFLAIRISSP